MGGNLKDVDVMTHKICDSIFEKAKKNTKSVGNEDG
jgi:hypothetical protein